ncbi:Cyp6g1 [Trypoxylus dichotomus]
MFEIGFFMFLILCVLCYVWLKKHQSYWKQKNVPFEKPIPLVGNMLDVVLMKQNMANVVGTLYFKYLHERFFGIWSFNEPHLVLRCPDLIKQVLIKDFDYFADRNVQSNENVDPISANMLFFTKNPKWRFIRTSMTPMFSSGKLKYIYPQIQSIAKNMVSFVSDRSSKILFIKNVAAKYATDVICSIAFGINAHSFQDRDTEFTDIGKGVFEISLRNAIAAATYFSSNPLADLFRIKFIKATIANFVSVTFINIMKERQSTTGERKDIVDLMIKLKNDYNLKDHEIVAQAMLFFLAGYETTNSTITFAIYEISLNKEIQSKLRKEINNSIGNNEEFLYYALKDMSYLHKIVCETLRKYPPAPLLGRICTKDYTIPDSSIVLEKGTAIMIPLMGLHYDPLHFPNPQTFDPERFSDANIAKRHPFCYLPFGDVQRNCIGKRIGLLAVKMALAHLIRNFEFELTEGTKFPLELSPKTFLLATDPIKDHELVAQVAQFSLGGYETTTTTIALALHELSLNREVQSKLRKEINASIEKGEEFSYDTLQNMSYLDNVISETPRKYLAVPLLGCISVKDYTILTSDIVIQKDTPIMIPLLGLHYDSKYFPDPQKFDPERFSDENVPYCYLPFGDGQRNCIGRRIGLLITKMALAHLIRNFEIEALKGITVPLKFLPHTLG